MSIFSTYRQGENRVTSTLLAVLEELPLRVVSRLLGILTDEAGPFVSLRNQVSDNTTSSIPDGQIIGSFHVVIETKTSKGAVDLAQLHNHLEHLKRTTTQRPALLVITPDAVEPTQVSTLSSQPLPIIWRSFQEVWQCIESECLSDDALLGERETYLLRQLHLMWDEDGLLKPDRDVLIVAASRAWPEYQKTSLYICQGDRSFRRVSRIGFYAEQRIQASIPQIVAGPALCVGDESSLVVELLPHVLGERDGKNSGQTAAMEGEIRKHLLSLFRQNAILPNRLESPSQVFLLSAGEDPRTVVLPRDVLNDLKDKNGATTPFTYGQRYVSLKALESVATQPNPTTTALDEAHLKHGV